MVVVVRMCVCVGGWGWGGELEGMGKYAEILFVLRVFETNHNNHLQQGNSLFFSLVPRLVLNCAHVRHCLSSGEIAPTLWCAVTASRDVL